MSGEFKKQSESWLGLKLSLLSLGVVSLVAVLVLMNKEVDGSSSSSKSGG